MSTTLNKPNRYQALFNRLQQEQMGAFIPFITLGDPNLERSFEIINTLIESGADALELGIPFSDPLADGPTIQNANLRAFAANVTPDECFALLTKVRQQHPDIPIGLLMYANLVFSNGIDNFYAKCQQTGIDSVLIADVPLEESEEFRHSAKKHGIAPVFICPPNADDDLIKTLAQKGEAYTYLLSRAGVTGSENRDHKPLEHLIQKLKENGAPPPVQGFGISEPSQVQESLKMGTAGAISGSAIVQLIEDHLETPEIMLTKIAEFVRSMKAATNLS